MEENSVQSNKQQLPQQEARLGSLPKKAQVVSMKNLNGIGYDETASNLG